MGFWAWIAAVAGAITAGIGLIAALTAGIVKTWRFGRKVGRFFDVFFGYDDNGTHVPGVLERLTRVERQIVEVRQQVLPNGGSSLRDAVDTIGVRLDRHIAEAAVERTKFAEHARRTNESR